jgi:NAD(P)-dependent dehydrogenase (short-subunit alcohol dehydrogenase family)
MKSGKKVAVVTGGASGLGKACVELLTQSGMQVVVWDRQADKMSVSPFTMDCDVTQEDSVRKALDQTIKQAGTPRICVNCAGIAPAQRLVGKEGAMPLSAFEKVIAVNLIGTFNVMRLVAEAMIKLDIESETEERGVFINTASVAAFEGQIGQMAYSASKGGIVSMTLPAARELAQFAIRVNTIAPGIFATPMLSGMPKPVQESLAATVTFPKRLGRPEEYAALVLHIIQNRMINGETIRLDGALRMQAK